MTDQRGRRFIISGFIVLGVIGALLPWWRNHGYLRDFYDYGLVIAALGRMGAGEVPYVDFTTPIQAGFFGLSRAVEMLGGGTFRALTWGGAGLTVLMAASLPLLLARRWPSWAAVLLGTAVTAATAAQHTIIWHNTVGVLALALVAWSAAVAPVFRRTDWAWHALLLVGLLLGGLNKVNYQLVAVVVALAWALREGLAGRAGAGRIAGTGLAVLLAGCVLPVAGELLATGASPELWWRNVVGLAAADRAEPLGLIFSRKFLFAPIHDYYGPMLLPQAGLAGLVLCAGALAGCWPRRPADRGGRWDRALLPLAVLLSGAAGAALLATNQEIAYVGLGAWLVLTVSVWLGFAGTAGRPAFLPGLVLPAAVIGGAAWISAWQGQRSQFGYSESPRSAYRLADEAGPALRYLHGMRLPPEQVQTLAELEKWLPGPGADGRRPIFYGLGTEWLGRIWPEVGAKGRPLWIHWGTSYGGAETHRLIHELGTAGGYQLVMSSLARDFWPPECRRILEQFYTRSLIGPVTVRWARKDGWQMQCKDGLDFVNRFGGNVAGPVLRLEALPLGFLRYENDRLMLGVTQDEGRMLLGAPSYRFGADAVLERLAHAGPGLLHARFKVIVHGATPEVVRWAQEVELPAGQRRVSVPFMVDALAQPLELRVTVDDLSRGQLAAGYRNLQITHAIDAPEAPPELRVDQRPAVEADSAQRASLLGETAWRPQQLWLQDGRAAAAGLELAAGGEVWLHTDGMLGELRGQLTCPDPAGVRPMVRVVWYKGGRLQIMQQGAIPAGGAFDFHVWCAEPGGWFGILLDPGDGVAPALVRVTGANVAP
jgi:hypothetical protein